MDSIYPLLLLLSPLTIVDDEWVRGMENVAAHADVTFTALSRLRIWCRLDKI